jgi:hypothetical protein
MFGKSFDSMYRGSMMGAGSHVFAVWGFVISNQKPDREVGFQVELNVKLLAMVIGDTEDRMQAAVDYLCAVDPGSRTPDDDGRRLIKLGPFDYRVVNGKKYNNIRNEGERREQNREAQQRHRDKAVPAKPKRKETIRERVKRLVAEDDVTVADNKQSRRLHGLKAKEQVVREPTTMEREYDLDDAGDAGGSL